MTSFVNFTNNTLRTTYSTQNPSRRGSYTVTSCNGAQAEWDTNPIRPFYLRPNFGVIFAGDAVRGF